MGAVDGARPDRHAVARGRLGTLRAMTYALAAAIGSWMSTAFRLALANVRAASAAARRRGSFEFATLAVVLVGGLAHAQGLSVWTPATGTMLDTLRQEARAFEGAFEVEVEISSLPEGELALRMVSDAADGEAADVVAWLPHVRLASLQAEGVLGDLSGVVTSGYLDTVGPNAHRALGSAEGAYALPMSVEGPALLYDRNVVKQLPRDYPAFVERARALTDEGRYGFLVDASNFYFAYGWLRTFGGYLFGGGNEAPHPGDVGLASDGSVRGIAALRALVHEYEVIPPDVDYQTAHAAFRGGRAAMFYSGPWAVGPAREAGIDVGVAPMPPLQDGTSWTAWMEVRGAAVNPYTAASREAANLVKWLARPQAQATYARRAGAVPAAPEAFEALPDGNVYAAFGEALLAADPIPTVPEMGGVWGPMGRALARILNDPSADVRAELTAAAREIADE